jgi:hypothetical protein
MRFRCAGRCHTRCAEREQAAAALVRVIPRVPVRHWILTVPPPLRTVAATDERLAATLCRALVAEVGAYLRRACGGEQARSEGGAVSLVHRVGRAFDTSACVHALVLDGRYVQSHGDAAQFVPLPDEPSERDLTAITSGIHARLQRAGNLVAAPCGVEQAVAPGPVVSTAVRRIHVQPAAHMPIASRRVKVVTDAGVDGFGVHAMERVEAHARGALQRLADYLVRAKVSLARVPRDRGDRVVQQLAVPWSDGTTHVEFSSRELAERLVALAPSERMHRVAYHGVLAPRASTRWRLSSEPLAVVSDERDRSSAADDPRAPRRALHPSTCSKCGGRLRVVTLEESADAALPGALLRRKTA